MTKKRYRKSVCRGNWLHKFRYIQDTGTGVLERCERCGLSINFPNNAPNLYYLQYNIRRVLRANDPLFKREFQNQ